MVSLNLGCGPSPSFEVRVDVTRHGTRANILADACQLPFRANSFDFIEATNILEHLPLHPYDALNEIAYICKSRGIIHIMTPVSEFKGLLLEVFAAPIIFLKMVKAKKNKKAFAVWRHLFLIKQRRLGKAGTGYGGHRWFLPWGWKVYSRFGTLEKYWHGLHIYYESYWVKTWCSEDGETYSLRRAKREELSPQPSEFVGLVWTE